MIFYLDYFSLILFEGVCLLYLKGKRKAENEINKIVCTKK